MLLLDYYQVQIHFKEQQRFLNSLSPVECIKGIGGGLAGTLAMFGVSL